MSPATLPPSSPTLMFTSAALLLMNSLLLAAILIVPVRTAAQSAPTASVKQAVAQNPREFGDNVVVHIALVVRDINKSARAYADLFGVEVSKITVTDPLEKTRVQFRGEPTGAQAKLAFLRLENITLELIEPVGGPSTWREFLEKKGEGVHHIAFRVGGMEENVGLLEKQGGKLIQKGDFTGGSYAYVDLTTQLGIIVELLTSANKK